MHISEIEELDGVQGVGAVTDSGPASRELTSTEIKTDEVGRAALDGLETPTDYNPAFEMLKATLAYEQRGINRLRETEDDTTQRLQMIDQLLALSSEITALKDAGEQELSEKVQSILGDLKVKGIDLYKGDEKVTKEQLIEMKSAIGAHIDKARTEVQQIFTKIQHIMTCMASVIDSSKSAQRDSQRLYGTISGNMRAR